MTAQTIEQAAQHGLPTGTVTFLFSDVESSTGLIERHGAAAHDALAKHHGIVADVIAAHRGHVFNIVGDGICSAFADAADAVAAAMDLQRALHAASFGDVGEVRVRVGLHTGEADASGGDYVSSLALVRAQRIMGAGHGGQTLLSTATAHEVRARLPARSTLRELGRHKLRGLAQPEAIFELVDTELPSSFPALRVEQADGAAPTDLLQDLVRGRLVGRASELDLLREHWRQAAEARGHLVLLSGEPGIGKTRLAQEIIDHARQAGAALMRGGCYEYEATTPYLPLIEASGNSYAPPALIGSVRCSARPPMRSRSWRPKSRPSSARCRRTRRCRPTRSGCGCSTTSRVSCRQWPRAAACCCSSTICIGRIRARCRCCSI